MGRPRLADVDTATPQRILDGALSAFGDIGFEAARLEDIARAAGITRPSLLYHFPSKEALYEAAIHRAFLELGSMLMSAMSERRDFPSRLVATARAYERYLYEHPELARLLLREMLDQRGPIRDLIAREIRPLLASIVRWAHREGTPHIRRGYPVRAALLQVASDTVLRAAAGPLRDDLWGARYDIGATLRSVFFTGVLHG
jgi:AcrR family transcriptional regulator